MDRELREEDFMLDEETEDDEPWDREDEVFANAKLTRTVDVRELIEARKNWGKLFDLILRLIVNVKDEGDAIKVQEEPQVVDKVEVAHNSRQ